MDALNRKLERGENDVHISESGINEFCPRPQSLPLSSYAFRIRAENDVGKSDYSKEIAVTTTIEGM